MYDFYRLFTNLYNLLFPFLAAFNVKSKCIFYFLSTWFWSKDSSLLFTFLYQEAKVKSKWNSQIYFWIYFFTLLLFADVHTFRSTCKEWVHLIVLTHCIYFKHVLHILYKLQSMNESDFCKEFESKCTRFET